MYPPTCATLRDEPSCNTRRIRVIKSRLEFAPLPASIVPRVVNTASACNVADAKQCSNSLVLIGGHVIMYDRRCKVGFEKPMRVNSFVWKKQQKTNTKPTKNKTKTLPTELRQRAHGQSRHCM